MIDIARFKLEKYREEDGITLVEVLAALVILSIVFIGFMLIFPQMTTFNKKTETKLETMNIARQEIVKIQDNSFENPLNLSDIESNIIADSVKSFSEQVDRITISYEKNGREYEADFFKEPDLPKDGFSGNSFLHKVHLKVMVDGKMNSETFGYISIFEN